MTTNTPTRLAEPEHLDEAVERMEAAVSAIRHAYVFESDPLMTELLEGCCADINALNFRLRRYVALRRAK